MRKQIHIQGRRYRVMGLGDFFGTVMSSGKGMFEGLGSSVGGAGRGMASGVADGFGSIGNMFRK